MERLRTIISTYYVLQAVAIAAWWIAMFAAPAWRTHFVTAGCDERSLLAFCLPDSVVLIIGSIVTARMVTTRRAGAGAAAWMVAGGVVYAMLYVGGVTVFTGGGGWMNTAMMIPPAAISTWCAWRLQDMSSASG